MVGRNLIPDASGPVAPASTGRTGGPKIIWAKPSQAPVSQVQRVLQSSPSANTRQDNPVSGFFRPLCTVPYPTSPPGSVGFESPTDRPL